MSQKMALCEPGQTSAYSKDLRRVLQWYSVHWSPVDPEDWLIDGVIGRFAVESLAEAVELTSCGIVFKCES